MSVTLGTVTKNHSLVSLLTMTQAVTTDIHCNFKAAGNTSLL
jgi:hypothetical protein